MKSTPQLDQWRGNFDNSYIERNPANEERLRITTAVWAKLLDRVSGDPPGSILEVGGNIGANLHALRRLTNAQLWAIEPNDTARRMLADSGVTAPHHILSGTAQEIPLEDGCVDLAFTAGVLIHIAPDDLLAACKEIHRCARKYIICMEYFADEPEEKAYRGERGLLFKRDFGSFYLDNFRDLIPVDCGFSWRRLTGYDNSTWWIFAKRGYSGFRAPS
jgi:pseudaminic acid biosynthesis-associated methylase